MKGAKNKLQGDARTAFEERVFGPGGQAAYTPKFLALQALVKRMTKTLEEHSGTTSKGK